MSLLLEALKKAEKAKEEARLRADATSPGAGLRLQEDPPKDRKPVTTRRELPDISQSLEILTDDIAPKPRPLAAAPARPGPAAAQPRPRPVSPLDASSQPFAQASAQASDRASARKVFEAKFSEPNPRLPFYLTLGALSIATVCTVGYFWYQLRPPSALVNAAPAKTSETPQAATAATTTSGAPSSAPVPNPAAVFAPAIPGLPAARTRPPVAAASPALPEDAALTRAPTSPAARQPVAPPRSVIAVQPARAQAAYPADAEPVAPRAAAQVNPKVESAYVAFLAGDMPRALADYQEALQGEPRNRDALLGLAAVDVRSGRLESAEAIYVQLLRADPRDSNAQAGLLALRSGRMDPLLVESRIKTLLAADPGAHVLNFTLGNQFAQQGRWAEAQQQYLKAFVAEPENADCAYTHAVSLDHLRQAKLAIDYYQRALALASTRGAAFDAAAARERISQLGK